MVKRLKDMTEAVSIDAKADSKKTMRDIEGLNSLVSVETDSSDDRRQNSQAMVPDTCPVCDMNLSKDEVKYYDVALLKKFLSVRGKIIPRSKSGVCATHQRALKEAIHRARYLALLPYVDLGQG